jgi:hypothetical protein
MAIAWEQLVFGKLVQSPMGPIVPRLDYRVTGISSGYPQELISRSHPLRTGLNTSDLFDWQKFPWNAGGGFILRPVPEGGRPAILAGRIRSRSERGEGEAGRPYVQAHYAVTSVEQWHPAVIALLPALLDASPMTAENRSMVNLRLEDAAIQGWFNRPLEPGWIENIAQLLTAVMSGIPFSVQEPQASLDDFLDQCALCACAVPRTLAWRLSIGAGLAEMRNDVSLGLGQFAPPNGFRKVGPNMLGDDLPALKSGRIYVEWLRQHASGVRTRSELWHRVADLLPGFADAFSVSAELDARGAAEKIASEVTELSLLDKLHAWLAGSVDQRPEVAFRRYRKQALEAVLGRLRLRGLQLLPEFVLPGWSEVFADIARENPALRPLAGAIARLGGLDVQPPDANDVAEFASDSLPVEFVQRIEGTLNEVLARNGLDDRWTGYVRDGFGQVPWLQGWFERSNDLWFWFAVDQAETRGSADLLSALRNAGGGAVVAFEALRSGAPYWESVRAAAALIDSAARLQRTTNLDWLFTHFVELKRVAAAIVLAETSWRRGIILQSARMLFTLEPRYDSSRNDLARALCRDIDASSADPDGTVMVSLLVATSRAIDIGDRLKVALGRQLGNPLAGVLIDTADSAGTPSSADAREIARLACSMNPNLIEGLWRHLCHAGHPSGSLEDVLLELMLDRKFPVSQANEKIRFVAHLLRGLAGELPASLLTRTEVEFIRHLLKDRTNLILEAIAGARRRTQLVNGLELVGKISAPRPANFDLIIDLIEARIERWTDVNLPIERLREWDWHREPVWRILFLPWAEAYNTTESISASKHWEDNISLLAGWGSGIRLAPEEMALSDHLRFSRILALAAFGVDGLADGRLLDRALVMREMQLCSVLALEGLAHYFRRSAAEVGDIGEILVTRVCMSRSDTAQLLEVLSHSKWLPRLTRENLSPLVRATRKILKMLPHERYGELEHRLVNAVRDVGRSS